MDSPNTIDNDGGATRPLPRMGAWRNSTKTQQPGHAPMSGPEVKNGSGSANDGASKRLRCGTIQKEVVVLSLPDLLKTMGARRNFTVTQQWGHIRSQD